MAIFIVAMGLFAGLRHLFDIRIPSYENLTANTLLPTESQEEYIMHDEPSDNHEIEEFSQNDMSANNVKDNKKDEEPGITIPDSINNNTTLYRISGKIWSYDECFADTQEQEIWYKTSLLT